MDPSQTRAIKVKHTALRKREIGSSFQLPKRPRTGSASVPQQLPLMRNDLQAPSYELIQGSKYVNGRQIDWTAYVHTNFYAKVHNFLNNIRLVRIYCFI